MFNTGMNELIELLSSILPSDVLNIVKLVLKESSYKSIKITSLSFILTVWAASSGFAAVLRLLNKACGQKECRGFIKIQLVCLILTAFLGIIILIVLSLIVFGKVNLGILYSISRQKIFNTTFLNIIILIVGAVILFLSFVVLYRYAPCKRPDFKRTVYVSLSVTIVWLVTSRLFSWYIENFSSYSKLYGSLGAVLIFMIWLYINSIIVLIGGEELFPHKSSDS